MKSTEVQNQKNNRSAFFTNWQIQEKTYQTWRITLYLLITILLNVVASSWVWRFDLTEHKTYSLAEVSKETVALLEEPVTIRAYLSSNLPSTYNILSSSLRDLLQGFQSHAKSAMFSYSVNIIDSSANNQKTKKLIEEAGKYGIAPVQMQGSDGNEFKAISAYVGLVISQGDKQEIISPLEPSSNIQYQITKSLQKMSKKSSVLLSLNNNLRVYYYFSPHLATIEKGKYSDYPQLFQKVIQKANEQLYGKIEGKVIDPENLPPGIPSVKELNINKTEVKKTDSTETETLYSALVIDKEGEYEAFSLLQMQPTVKIGRQGLVQGEELALINPSQLDGQLTNIITSVLGIAQNIGYIADRDTASFSPPNPRQPEQRANLAQLSREVQDLFHFKAVQLNDGIPKDINVLFLVDPLQQLTDWDLYQIDQFVMSGGRLIVAMQPYQIQASHQMYGGASQFIPNPNLEGVTDSSGDKKQQYTLVQMLHHYGIRYEAKLLLDKRSFTQRGKNPQTGSYQEKRMYYIPEIYTQWGSTASFIKPLKLLYSMLSAPLSPVLELKEEKPPQTISLLKSSPESWTEEMQSGNKDLHSIMPPAAEKQSQYSIVMATAKGTKLTSFFTDKKRPTVPSPSEKEDSPKSTAEKREDLDFTSLRQQFITDSKYGRVLVSGSSMLFDAQLIELPGNKALALNLLDYIVDHESMANLRARIGMPNTIDQHIGSGLKNFIKWFNIIGLPFLVGVMGILMLFHWRHRQVKIAAAFLSKK